MKRFRITLQLKTSHGKEEEDMVTRFVLNCFERLRDQREKYISASDVTCILIISLLTSPMIINIISF